MLVLSRSRNDAVVLIDPAGKIMGEISVYRISGDRVRLGFEGFSQEIRIFRKELCEKVGIPVLLSNSGTPLDASLVQGSENGSRVE
jgi:sRNA-binding carbon storage regulator CsrA